MFIWMKITIEFEIILWKSTTVITNLGLWEQLQENFDTMAPQQFFAIANVSDITNVDVENAHKLVEYYMGSEENLNPDHFQGLVDMYTDSWFAYGHHKTVDYLMKHGVPVFQYLFAYEG